MELSPEEKRKIYEEERAKLEAEKKGKDSPSSAKGNVRALLCYVGFWVTGIIFLIIEKQDKTIRWHAMQALVTFGILDIIWGIASAVRWQAGWLWGFGGFGGFLSPAFIAATVIFIVFFVIWWVLWAVLMYKAYHNQVYRVPVFAGIADKCLAALDKGK